MVTCEANVFNKLMNVNYWPSNCKIRELDMDRKTSTGAKLTATHLTTKSPSKGETTPSTELTPNTEKPAEVRTTVPLTDMETRSKNDVETRHESMETQH